MKRIFGGYAYGNGPRAGCWWDETCSIPDHPPPAQDIHTDVAIVGGGFTGLSAALHLARAGVAVRVLEARDIGWGASGRNGGFCCLGGSKAADATLDRRFGKAGRIAYRRAELAAVELVDQLTQGVDIDRHSRGETCLAHRPKDFAAFPAEALRASENYGIESELTGPADLAAQGLNGPFHGALTLRAGFGLNPRKYLAWLAAAAQDAGAHLHGQSAVTDLRRQGDGWRLRCGAATVHADRVILGTNGYSSDDLPGWLSGRYLPTQSNVIVTRPLTPDELEAQGWTSDQMSYDSRNLLHYFRLLPDRRFLFGMRGGILTGPAAEARARRRIRRDFDAMFPAWRGVETPHGWSGMVCIARDSLPFVGPIPGLPGVFAGLCYHGNGVAMGSYSGALLADLVQGKRPARPYPQAMQQPLRRFPLGPFRRALVPPAYAGFALADR